VSALAVGAHWQGLEGAAAAVGLADAAVGVPVLEVIMRLLSVGLRELGGVVLRPAAGWACLAVALLAGRQLLGGLPELELIALVAVGATVYALTVAVFARDGTVTLWLSLRGAPPSEPPPATST
jgi:hypothetical protein